LKVLTKASWITLKVIFSVGSSLSASNVKIVVSMFLYGFYSTATASLVFSVFAIFCGKGLLSILLNLSSVGCNCTYFDVLIASFNSSGFVIPCFLILLQFNKWLISMYP
jgi:hypothetical protein